MPDPVLFAKAVGAAAVASVLVTLAVAFVNTRLRQANARPPATPTPTGTGVSVVVGIGLGGALGFYILGDLPPRSLAGAFPHWSVSNVLDRFLVVILPLTILVELAGESAFAPRWLIWFLRLGLAAGVGRALLHGSSYLLGTAGNWTVTQVWAALGAGALILAAAWILLGWLSHRRAGISLPLALSQTCLAAGITVMLSGYTDGGAAGLLLAASAGGAVLAARLRGEFPATDGAMGIGLVGLFGILVMGRFFGELSTGRALALFLAPLFCWASELPALRDRKPWVVGTVRLVLVALPLIFVLGLAKRDFDRDMAEPYAVERDDAKAVIALREMVYGHDLYGKRLNNGNR